MFFFSFFVFFHYSFGLVHIYCIFGESFKEFTTFGHKSKVWNCRKVHLKVATVSHFWNFGFARCAMAAEIESVKLSQLWGGFCDSFTLWICGQKWWIPWSSHQKYSKCVQAPMNNKKKNKKNRKIKTKNKKKMTSPNLENLPPGIFPGSLGLAILEPIQSGAGLNRINTVWGWP